MKNWGTENWMLNRWGMDKNYLPVTIGVADGRYYEEIYPTKEDFQATWGSEANNYIVYFSDPNDYVPVEDAFWDAFRNPPYYLQVITVSGTAINGYGFTSYTYSYSY
jgi:hypothetical protein